MRKLHSKLLQMTAMSEPLESRKLLHAAGQPIATLSSRGTLTLIGLEATESWVVIASGNDINVNEGGQVVAFPAASVQRIFYDGLGGDDFVQLAVAFRSTLLGGDGNDTLLGGTRQDFITGGVGADFLSGGSGDDSIFGDGGQDRIYGKGGNDSLVGGASADRIYGGIGDDILDGQRDADTLTGAEGNDSFFGGGGVDTTVDYDDKTEIIDGVEHT